MIILPSFPSPLATPTSHIPPTPTSLLIIPIRWVGRIGVILRSVVAISRVLGVVGVVLGGEIVLIARWDHLKEGGGGGGGGEEE